jgi:hypothetical protein
VKRRRAAGLAAAALLLAAVTPAAAQDEVLPYAGRLDLPVEIDTIGSPRSVTADVHTGEVFVSDLDRDRLVIFGPDGSFRFQIRGGEVFRAPRDVAVDPAGFLYLLASQGTRQVLLKLDFDGLPVAEIVPSGYPEDVDEPVLVSLALSPAGDRLYLLDSVNGRLWLAGLDGRVTGGVDLAEGLSESQADDLQVGHVDVYGDQVLVAIASMGELQVYDHDGGNRRKYGIRGTAPCQLGFPVAAARDAGGDYWIVDQQRMLIVRWSPVGNRCVSEHWGFGGNPGYFYFPFDLGLGPEGRLYVSQGYEGRVQAYQSATGAAGPTPPHTPEDGAAVFPPRGVTRISAFSRGARALPAL